MSNRHIFASECTRIYIRVFQQQLRDILDWVMLCCKAGLCFAECLAASLSSMHWMLVAPFTWFFFFFWTTENVSRCCQRSSGSKNLPWLRQSNPCNWRGSHSAYLGCCKLGRYLEMTGHYAGKTLVWWWDYLEMGGQPMPCGVMGTTCEF